MANVKYLQQFISFVNRDGANIDVIRVHSSQNDFERSRYLGTMVYVLNDFNKFAEVDYTNHPLIKYNEISDIFSSIVKNWFVFAKNCQHIIGLILQDYFYRGAFDENRFLNLVRALEIFHAFKDPSTKMSVHDFELKLAEIIKHVPDEYKKEVLEDLKYTNNLTLNMRLKALISETENKTIGYDTKLDKKFVNDLKNSRNYYTHYNPTLKKQALKGGELEKITETCRTLLNYLILKYLAVPQEILAISFQYYFENSYYSNYFI